MPFLYIDRSEVYVEVDGALLPASSYTWASPAQIKLTASPESLSGKSVRRYRKTNIDTPAATFRAGGFDHNDLNLALRQGLHFDQESEGRLGDAEAELGRTLRAPDDMAALPVAADRAGKSLVFGLSGEPGLANVPSDVTLNVFPVFVDTTLNAIGTAFSATQKFVVTAGYSSVGDKGGALWRWRSTMPSHPGRFVNVGEAGGWFEHYDAVVCPEHVGAFGADTAAGLVDQSALLETAAEIANGRGMPLTARGKFYRSDRRRSMLSVVPREGSATLLCFSASSPWRTTSSPVPVLSPYGAVRSDTVAGEVPLTLISQGYRTFYEAFPRVAEVTLSGGGQSVRRLVTVAYCGLGHSPNFNVSPVDAEFGAGQFGDVVSYISDDGGSSWQGPYVVCGNMLGPDAGKYSYTAALGVNHDGELVLITRQISTPGEDTRTTVVMRSRDGVQWSQPIPIVCSTIEEFAGTLNPLGQPFSCSVFGDIVRSPDGKTLFALGTCGGTTSVTFDSRTGTVGNTTKYLMRSTDGGTTWYWQRIIRTDKVPTAINPGLTEGVPSTYFLTRDDRVFPSAATGVNALSEEGVIIPVSAKEIVVIHRTGGVSTMGCSSYTTDGVTWQATSEATSGSIEQTGYAMPQAGHTLTINGVPHVAVHIGMRWSNSAPASKPFSVYTAVCPVDKLMAGSTTDWRIVRRQSFQRIFETDLTHVDAWRDCYVGVVFDPGSGLALFVIHDETGTSRTSLLYSYRIPLLDIALSDITADTVTAGKLKVTHSATNDGAWFEMQDAYTGHDNQAAVGGIKFYGSSGTLHLQMGRIGSNGAVDFNNLLPEANNGGFIWRVMIGGVSTVVGTLSKSGFSAGAGIPINVPVLAALPAATGDGWAAPGSNAKAYAVPSQNALVVAGPTGWVKYTGVPIV